MAEWVDYLTPYLESQFEELHPADFYRMVFPEGYLQKKRICLNPQEEDRSLRVYDYGSDAGKFNGIAIELFKEYEKVINRKTGKEEMRKKIRRYTVTDDLEILGEIIERENFALISPLAYIGRSRAANNVRVAFGIAVDVDGIRLDANHFPIGLKNLVDQTENEPGWTVGRIPKPTCIVSSGTGLHLYYLFKAPIYVDSMTADQMQKLKRKLTEKIWHDSIVNIDSSKDIQQEGIYQGFRLVGGITKKGGRVRAFLFDEGERVDFDYLNKYVKSPDRVKESKPYDLNYESKERIKVENAVDKWKLDENRPDWFAEWYDTICIKPEEEAEFETWYKGVATEEEYKNWEDKRRRKKLLYDKKRNFENRGEFLLWYEKNATQEELFAWIRRYEDEEDFQNWKALDWEGERRADRRYIANTGIAFSRAIYDWWKREIAEKAKLRHRYWCISMLAVFAVKCSYYDSKTNRNPVTYDELVRDAFSFVPLFNEISKEEPFTDEDVMAALEFWNDEKNWRYYKNEYISYRAGFEVKSDGHIKRNGRKREDHLELVKMSLEQKKRAGELKTGRPNKQREIYAWRILHPNGSKSECARMTEISAATVRKWWGDEKLEITDEERRDIILELFEDTEYKEYEL